MGAELLIALRRLDGIVRAECRNACHDVDARRRGGDDGFDGGDPRRLGQRSTFAG